MCRNETMDGFGGHSSSGRGIGRVSSARYKYVTISV